MKKLPAATTLKTVFFYTMNLTLQCRPSVFPIGRGSIIQHRFLQRPHHQDILLHNGSARNVRSSSSSVFWQCNALFPSPPASQIILPSADMTFYRKKKKFHKSIKIINRRARFWFELTDVRPTAPQETMAEHRHLCGQNHFQILCFKLAFSPPTHRNMW